MNAAKAWIAMQIAVGLAIVYFLWKFVNAGKNAVAKISKAADVAVEKSGYANSDGQNDPLLLYNLARIQYAKDQGYAPGSAEWQSPPGFPDQPTWQAQNSQGSPQNTNPGMISNFWSAL